MRTPPSYRVFLRRASKNCHRANIRESFLYVSWVNRLQCLLAGWAADRYSDLDRVALGQKFEGPAAGGHPQGAPTTAAGPEHSLVGVTHTRDPLKIELEIELETDAVTGIGAEQVRPPHVLDQRHRAALAGLSHDDQVRVAGLAGGRHQSGAQGMRRPPVLRVQADQRYAPFDDALDRLPVDAPGAAHRSDAGEQGSRRPTAQFEPRPQHALGAGRGMPAARFWEFEDARVEFGLVSVGPSDLTQLMMIEYAGSYGNDWFVIPLELPVGSLTSVDSLVVTDTFGVRTLLRPLGDPALAPPNWSMFQHAYMRRAGMDVRGIAPNLFFLAPALGRSLQSAPLEEVLFMRDEMANMAWAIERSIESPLGQSMNRSDAAALQPAPPPPVASADAIPRYRLSSAVPANWIPLLPVQLPGPAGAVISRLQRAAVLEPDGSQQVRHALGDLLKSDGPLLLHDEEVPREGVRVTRHYQMARWTDGATFAWIAHRKQVGRGEGSSGLRFDSIEE